MTDFETHPRGTAEELRLSRELAREIEQLTAQYGKVIPHNVLNAYNTLKTHYDKQMEAGML